MLFRRKSKKNAAPGKDKIAGWMAAYLLRVQNAFACFMAAKTAGLSGRVKTIYLLIFCLLFGGLSLNAFIGVFQKRSNTQLKPAQLSVPKYYDKPGDNNMPVVTSEEMRGIIRFKRYMDSLQMTETGKASYDSILAIRPGLMDSLQMMESFYRSQSK